MIAKIISKVMISKQKLARWRALFFLFEICSIAIDNAGFLFD